MDITTTGKEGEEPPLEYFYSNIEDTLSFFPDAVKTEFLTGKVEQSVAQGAVGLLDNSPRAQKLKSLVELSQRHLSERKRESVLNKAVSFYLNQKKSQKQVQVLKPPSPPTNATVASIGTSTTFHLTQPATSLQLNSTPKQKTSQPHSVAESLHTHVAAAIDTLGPGIVSYKSYKSTATNSKRHGGWYIRIFKCFNKSCMAKFRLLSPTKELNSAPAIIRIEFSSQHEAHNPIDWNDWYRYAAGRNTKGLDWDETTYPRHPGLPCFIQMGVEDLLRINPNESPAQVNRYIGNRFNDHPLFLNPGSTTQFIAGQIHSLVRRLRKTKLDDRLVTVKRVIFTGDIWQFILSHRINYSRLTDINWEAKPRRGFSSLRAMSFTLKTEKVLSGLGGYAHLPEMDLIVLDSDDVPNDARWRLLVESSDKTHMTGPDPRRRTVVFSSIALLANAVWCADNNWEVCAGVDGTHGLSKSSYKLITLGVYGFSQDKGHRTFHPLVYIWGEGEREIVALHGFLNMKIALQCLFGIPNVCFKRGVVTDASTAFANSLTRAFPGSPILSCYPHIIRKFMLNDRCGNGTYASNLKTQPKVWLRSKAEKDIRRCSLCKTTQQKKMWEMTERKWTEEGEGGMSRTFAKTYIEDERFSKWHYTAAGAHGNVPCNNPMERHNLAIKGCKNFFGYIEIGHNMYLCLTKEFPRLVYRSSTDLACPSSGLPVLDFDKAMNNDQFMDYQSLVDDTVDIRGYGGGWLINDVEYLREKITEDDIQKMESALAGEIEDNACVGLDEDIRDVFLSRTRRFHLVKEAVWPSENGNMKYFECDCRDYYYQRWCFASAYMQHRNELRLLGQKFTNKVTNSSKSRRYTLVAKALQRTREKLQRKKNA